MKSARELLRKVTANVPPPEGRRHCFTLNDNGDLTFHLAIGERWIPIPIEEGDFDKGIEPLERDIRAVAVGATAVALMEKRQSEGDKTFDNFLATRAAALLRGEVIDGPV